MLRSPRRKVSGLFALGFYIWSPKLTLTTKPNKRAQHACLEWRTYPEHDDPPPTLDEVRRELGLGPIPYTDEPKEHP